jgi:ribonuclease P protein component
MNFRFRKSEKLKSSKTIEKLFSEGKSFTKFPLKLVFLPQELEKPTQAAFAVPKRSFKLAVDRNRIKRQLRETYRLHKPLIITNNGKNFALLFLYFSKDKPKYAELEKAMTSLLKKLRDEIT